VLRNADLTGATLAMADMSLIDGRMALMAGANLRGARMQRAALSGAMLADVQAGPLPIRGRSDWATNLSYARLVSACLARADFGQAILRRADLSKADLQGTNLSGASLCEAVARGADLRNIRLEGADMTASVGFEAKVVVP